MSLHPLQPTPTPSPRQVYLDSSAGLLLVYMIALHCFTKAGFGPQYLRALAMFNILMPWFFTKAGMFFRPRRIANVAANGWRRLLLPYIIWTAIGILSVWGLWLMKGEPVPREQLEAPWREILWWGSATGDLPIWFLTSLLAVRLIYAAIHRFTRENASDEPSPRTALWVLIIGALLTSGLYYLRLYTSVDFPYYVINIPSGLTFFAWGVLLRHLEKRRQLWAVLGVIYLVVMIVQPVMVDMRMMILDAGWYPLYFPMMCIGIAAINTLCHKILDKPNPFSWIGRNSMPFYVMHWLVINAVATLFTVHAGNLKYLAALIIANIIVLPVATAILRRLGLEWVFGE